MHQTSPPDPILRWIDAVDDQSVNHPVPERWLRDSVTGDVQCLDESQIRKLAPKCLDDIECDVVMQLQRVDRKLVDDPEQVHELRRVGDGVSTHVGRHLAKKGCSSGEIDGVLGAMASHDQHTNGIGSAIHDGGHVSRIADGANRCAHASC